MLKSCLDFDCVKNFLSDVTEQIQYKHAREQVERELKGHIEDRTLELIDEGIPEEKAIQDAVKRMGDATAIGVEMNQSYSLQKSTTLYILMGISLLSGIFANLFYGYDISYSDYFVWGILVLLGVVTVGYRFLVKNIKLLYLLYGMILAVFIYRFVAMQLEWYRFPLLHTISYTYNLIYLVLPVFAIVLYKVRNANLFKIIGSFVIILLPVLLQSSYKRYVISGSAILILSAIILFFILVTKNYFAVGIKKVALVCAASNLLSIGEFWLSAWNVLQFTIDIRRNNEYHC